MEPPPILEPDSAAPRSPKELLLSVLFVLAALAGLLLSAAAYALGLLFNWLFVLMILLACGIAISRIAGLLFGNLELSFFRRPFARPNRKYLLQAINILIFAGLVGFVLRMAVIPAQFSAADFTWVKLWIALPVLFIVAASLAPRRRVRLSTNLFFSLGWLFLGMELLRIFAPVSPSEGVVLSPPSRGEWYVYHGGRSVLLNHHYPVRAQRDALDLGRTVKGREENGNTRDLDSYLSFGQAIYAPTAGVVVRAVNDRPDLPIGETDRQQLVGNHVVIDAGNGRYVLLAHLKKGSVSVTIGESVKTGDPVGQCGNSGNTSQPHLHLQAQSGPDILAPNVRTFPILFRDVNLIRAGKNEPVSLADPRRNDRLVAP